MTHGREENLENGIDEPTPRHKDAVREYDALMLKMKEEQENPTDRKIQGFDLETPEQAKLLYALLRTIMNGARKIANVETQLCPDVEGVEGGQHTVYITSEK